MHGSFPFTAPFQKRCQRSTYVWIWKYQASGEWNFVALKEKSIPHRVIIQKKACRGRQVRSLTNSRASFSCSAWRCYFLVLFFSFSFLLPPGILTHSPLDILPKKRSSKLVEPFSVRYHAKKKQNFPITVKS